MRAGLHPIPGLEGRYSITKAGNVFSHLTNRFVRPFTDRNGFEFIQLRIGDSVRKHFSVEKLKAKALGTFTGEMKDEEHRPVPGYDNYLITRSGEVYSLKTERYRVAPNGAVCLSQDGKTRVISINTLLKLAFG